MPSAPRPPPRPRRARPRLAPSLGALALGALALGAGCLPGDERPAPGVASVWLEGAEGLEAGAPFLTEDGWSITFERAVVASSGVRQYYLDAPGFGVGGELGGGCEVYYETSMVALYDVVAPGPRPLGRYAGLGDCGFGVSWGRFGGPVDVLGPGVSREDAARVAVDAGTGEPQGTPALYAAGVARKGAARTSFAWAVSTLAFLGNCGGPEEVPFRLRLGEGESTDVRATVHPERLFLDRAVGPAARLRFDPIADADERGDADGEVTRAELHRVPLAGLGAEPGAYELRDGGFGGFPPPSPGDEGWAPSLLDFVNAQARTVFADGERSLCADGNR